VAQVMRELVGVCLSGRYRLVTRIAGGGMGDVYRAHDLLLDRSVAVKVLQPSLAADPEHLERFKAEARSAARFSHPNVVAVYDWGCEDDDTYYMVMEYVAGSDLRDLLERRGAIEYGVALEIMADVCDALEAAHAVGLVHRDIKPENILIARDGKVKVADFGIAVVVDTDRAGAGTILGTVRYLSPEQARGRDATPLSDVWAAGAVLAELLTGRPPANGSGTDAVKLRAHQSPSAPSDGDPALPAEVDTIVLRACALDPADRYDGAAAMGDAMRVASVGTIYRKEPAVRELLGDLTGEVRLPDMAPTEFDPRSTKARAGRRARVRSRRRSALLGLVALMLLAFAGARAYAALTAPDRVEVPGLSELSKDDAMAALQEVGLDLEVLRREQSRSVEAGLVLEQEPASGTLLEGSPVTVVLSAGPPKVNAPDLTGMTRSQLEVRLRASGLELGTVSNKFDVAAEGTVVAQSPADRKVRWGSSVDVTLSKGPQSIEVPDAAGFKAKRAVAILEQAGFVAVLVDSYSDAVEEGLIISSDPGASTTAPEGGEVELYVSVGPEFEELTMPDVRNLPEDEARSRLEGKGLRVDVVQSCGGGTTVVDTDPIAGVTVRENETVALFVC